MRDKDELFYVLFGISADIAQMGRAYIRNENDRVITNINQIIKKLKVFMKESRQ